MRTSGPKTATAPADRAGDQTTDKPNEPIAHEAATEQGDGSQRAARLLGGRPIALPSREPGKNSSKCMPERRFARNLNLFWRKTGQMHARKPQNGEKPSTCMFLSRRNEESAYTCSVFRQNRSSILSRWNFPKSRKSRFRFLPAVIKNRKYTKSDFGILLRFA